MVCICIDVSNICSTYIYFAKIGIEDKFKFSNCYKDSGGIIYGLGMVFLLELKSNWKYKGEVGYFNLSGMATGFSWLFIIKHFK